MELSGVRLSQSIVLPQKHPWKSLHDGYLLKMLCVQIGDIYMADPGLVKN